MTFKHFQGFLKPHEDHDNDDIGIDVLHLKHTLVEVSNIFVMNIIIPIW